MSTRIGYTVRSLELALKEAAKNIGIDCEWPEEGIDCPMPNTYIGNLCNGNPMSCDKATERKCRRKIKVSSRPGAASCATLRIRYTVSNTDHNGFVEEDDSALQVILSRKYISKASLDPRVIHIP